MHEIYQLIWIIRENSVFVIKPKEIFFHVFASSQQFRIDLNLN